MESQPQNPEFRNNPENFHPCRWAREKSVFAIPSLPLLNTSGYKWISSNLIRSYVEYYSKGSQLPLIAA